MGNEVIVGKPYVPGHTNWTEAIEWNWTPDYHQLRLFFHNPAAYEIRAIRSGAFDFRLIEGNDILFLTFSFAPVPPMQRGLKTSDAPYSYHLLSNKELPPENPTERGLLDIILVDARTGITLVVRRILLSLQFTEELYKAIRKQSERNFDQAEYDRQLKRVYALYNSAQLAEKAVVRCIGGV